MYKYTVRKHEGKVYNLRTMGIRTALLRGTMIHIFYQLSDFYWNSVPILMESFKFWIFTLLMTWTIPFDASLSARLSSISAPLHVYT